MSANLSKKRRKNKLSESSSKFKLKANRSSINFKNKNKLKKLNYESSNDSDEESESSDDGKKGKKNRNKSKNKKDKKRKKNKFYNTKRSQSVRTLKHGHKNRMLRTTRSDIRKGNKFFNRTIQSESNSLRRRNNKNNYFFYKRSQTPNTERYRNKLLLKNNKNKFLRNGKINSAYTRGFNNFKRTSFDHNDKRYRFFGELDDRSRKNYLFGYNNRRRDNEDELRSLNFRTSKYTQNTSNYFKIGSRRFNFLNNYQREKEEGFFNRITLYPKIEDDKFYERRYLQGDDNPYSVKWPSHFLEIGYNSGFYYEDYQDGVPILRLRKLNNKVILPPINSRYSQASERPIEIPPLNFNGLTRQERINYILNVEANNDHNNVFKSAEARKKLLEKFKVKKNKKNNE